MVTSFSLPEQVLDTSYRNPVIPGFHPDPSVCRVGDDYYLVTSSFTYFPGVPIFHSTNLVEWIQIGNVLDRPSQLDLTGTTPWSSLGIYAPTIRYHDGRFWVITTNSTSKGWDTFFVTSEDPAGPWTDPVHVAIPGIDPDLAWDEQDRCWVHFSGVTAISRCQIDTATGVLLTEPESTWSGTGLQFPEAPHLFERNGTWYLLVAEGGTEAGHAVSIARGPSPEGPWEGSPDNPILTHRSTDRAVQNTGHADVVEGGDGSWWMVLLGIRRLGITPGFHVLGRETFLTPLNWHDGWPVPEPVELEMPAGRSADDRLTQVDERENFETGALAPEWVSVRRPPEEFVSLGERPGWLLTHGTETLDSVLPSFIGRAQRHLNFVARVRVDPASATEAGLALYLDETAHCEVAVRGNEVIARLRIGPLQQVLGRAPRPSGFPILSLGAKRGGNGPDTVTLAYRGEGGIERVLAEFDGRYISTEVAGGFLGRMIGMYAEGGSAGWDWFEYSGSDA